MAPNTPTPDEAGGYLKVFRKMFEKGDALYEPERVRTNWEAWICYFLGEANWAANTAVIANQVVTFRRGDILVSIRHLCRATGWSRDRATKHLEVLVQIGRLELVKRYAHAGTLYRVVNYDLYQDFGGKSGRSEGRSIGKNQDKHKAVTTTTTTTTQTAGAPRLVLDGEPVVAPAPAPTAVLGFDDFLAVYPERDGGNPRKAAESAWKARIKAGVSAEVLIDAARRYHAWCNANGRTGTEFVRMASTFLGPKGEAWLESWAVAGTAPASRGSWQDRENDQLAAATNDMYERARQEALARKARANQ